MRACSRSAKQGPLLALTGGAPPPSASPPLSSRSILLSPQVKDVAYTLTLAAQHSAAFLERAALQFAARNAATVVKTKGWAHLAATRPELKDKVIVALASRGARKGRGHRGRRGGRRGGKKGNPMAAAPAAAQQGEGGEE